MQPTRPGWQAAWTQRCSNSDWLSWSTADARTSKSSWVTFGEEPFVKREGPNCREPSRCIKRPLFAAVRAGT
jgi:hypothetical protein